ncbi:MAG: NUDIX hydrolase [Alphaproteobacteria bacterium]|nr:NUDIX hydrolase [Alphaproteobacteria bacterium]
MRRSARAILITKENKLLLMKRTKPSGVYYITIGGGIEENETPKQALLRELKEESGSIVENPTFMFHYEDPKRQNSFDFFVCREIERIKPTGTEWTVWNSPDNQYALVEVSSKEAKKLPIKPDDIKDKIIDLYEKAINESKEQ